MARETAKKRAADKLVALFEDQIRQGALAQGEALPPEREIVQTYGVSRTVAREAVLSLAGKGLVEARPGFRPVVKKPSVDTAFDIVGSLVPQLLQETGGVRNLFDLRIMMEASLVRSAAKTATKDDIQALKDALDRNELAVGESQEFYLTDMAFHGVLFGISDNPLMPAMHRAYSEWLAPHWLQMPRMEGRNQINFQSHKAIFNAILMRDPDAAEAALMEHMANAWQQVRNTFSDLS